MEKRTQNEIEKDYILIKDAAKTAKNFKEIEKITGLKYSEILTSLKKHPRVFNRIKKQFEQYHNSRKSVETKNDKKAAVPKIVIDTSVAGVQDIEKILEQEKSKVVLTQVVIKELARLQGIDDIYAMRARHLLAMPADNEEKFVHELISEEYETPDKCILEYCLKNKDDVILYTADKEMFNFAKVYNIPVKLFKALPRTDTYYSKRAITFDGIEKIGKDLIIDLDGINNKYRKVRVISDGKEYDTGIVNLKIGDQILLASSKKEGYVAFAHYKIISVWAKNHCDLIFSRRLYDLSKLEFNHIYKSFLRDFKRTIA